MRGQCGERRFGVVVRTGLARITYEQEFIGWIVTDINVNFRCLISVGMKGRETFVVDDRR